jgi:hypothetical protein
MEFAAELAQNKHPPFKTVLNGQSATQTAKWYHFGREQFLVMEIRARR